jgi:hypothetical protein
MIVSPGSTLLAEVPPPGGPPAHRSTARLDDVERRHVLSFS